MSYRYDRTSEERAAEHLLRSKGWSVSEPTCPLCHGWGFISDSKTWGSGITAGVSIGTKPCPNRCPAPMVLYSANL